MLLSSDQVGGSDVPVQQSYKVGELLFEEGLQGKEMFLIQEGKVGVFKNSPKGRMPISVVGVGGILGEQSIFGNHSRSATAIAVEPTRALIINQKHLHHVMESIPPWLYAMLKVIVTRLHEARLRVDQSALKDQERGLILILLLLLPRYKEAAPEGSGIDLEFLLQDVELICRLREKEARSILSRLEKRGLIRMERQPDHGEAWLVIQDQEALRLYDEFLLLKSRGERFSEAVISAEAVATLSNIAYVAQKSGQETIEGTALYKSAVAEDLSDLSDSALLEKNLSELTRTGLILMLPAEEETLIIFQKEKLNRIKKIREWLPKFEMELEGA
jgi:CRP/FNR family transcriptional regulator, cyclic AMP receptor protein